MYSKLTDKVILAHESNYTHSRSGYKICKITPHHMAAIWSGERCAKSFQNPSRDASANYCIGTDGDIVCNVPEEYRAWTSSDHVNDSQAITIEVGNSTGAPKWEISQKAWDSLVNLCVDVCQRYNFKLKFDGTPKGTLTMHKMFAATACPGPYLSARMNKLADEVNAKLGSSKPNPKPTGELYRVRKSWADEDSQLGAFEVLDNAKKLADKNKGYKVYDSKGNQVYPKPTPKPTKLKFKVGDKVTINGNLYTSSNATKPNGTVKNKVTKITRLAKGSKHPYNTTGDLGWMDEKDIKLYTSKPTTKPKVGDKVKVIKAINYDNGSRFALYYDTYDLIELVGNRAVIGKGKVVTAPIHINNIKKA